MAQHTFTYTVQGTTIFPLDMLRYDAAWPATSEDVNAISETFRLRSFHKGWPNSIRVTSHRLPNYARWESFGWTVSQ